jgi:membrane-bound lytic murein transglycosylase A
MRAALAALAVGLLAVTGGDPAGAEPTRRILPFAALEGWERDDHAAALRPFPETCALPTGSDRSAPCGIARAAADRGGGRAFVELLFRPAPTGGAHAATVTGGFGATPGGARRPRARFRVPLCRRPPESAAGRRPFIRAAIERGDNFDAPGPAAGRRGGAVTDPGGIVVTPPIGPACAAARED